MWLSTSDNIRIRIRSGHNEAEIEASLQNIRDAINLIPELLSKLPESQEPKQAAPPTQLQHQHMVAPQQARDTLVITTPVSPSGPSSLPAVTIEKGDSLSDVISKFFADVWGRNPRKLLEVREALQSYGLNYPKQSVAVALLRLAKSSKIRRFKGDGGEYVYTASTGAAPMPVTPAVVPEVHESAPTENAEAEQLELDSASL